MEGATALLPEANVRAIKDALTPVRLLKSKLVAHPVGNCTNKKVLLYSSRTSKQKIDILERLVGRVVTVSVETVRLVDELAQAVGMEDWMSETTEEN
jgi:Tfp pilus assembly protein FimT